MKNNIVVVIPVYKTFVTKVDIASLKQCLKVLNKYHICLICHTKLDLSGYKSCFLDNQVDFCVRYFDEQYFDSVRSYNTLMLSADFYRSFRKYQYMLIYQLDAFVFEDQLEYWCNKGYDYIGAP